MASTREQKQDTEFTINPLKNYQPNTDVDHSSSSLEKKNENVQPSMPKDRLNRKPIQQDAHQEKIQKVVSETKLALGTALPKGDCFFDAFAQALEDKGMKVPGDPNHPPYKKLRMLCDSYVKAQPKQENWAKSMIEKDATIETYLVRIQFTQSEIEEKIQQNLFPSSATSISGRPAIEGKILCIELSKRLNKNIKLHVIKMDLDESEEEQETVMASHLLIDQEGQKPVEEKEINYTDENIIHIAHYMSHYVPLVSSQPAITLRPSPQRNKVKDQAVTTSSSQEKKKYYEDQETKEKGFKILAFSEISEEEKNWGKSNYPSVKKGIQELNVGLVQSTLNNIYEINHEIKEQIVLHYFMCEKAQHCLDRLDKMLAMIGEYYKQSNKYFYYKICDTMGEEKIDFYFGDFSRRLENTQNVPCLVKLYMEQLERLPAQLPPLPADFYKSKDKEMKSWDEKKQKLIKEQCDLFNKLKLNNVQDTSVIKRISDLNLEISLKVAKELLSRFENELLPFWQKELSQKIEKAEESNYHQSELLKLCPGLDILQLNNHEKMFKEECPLVIENYTKQLLKDLEELNKQEGYNLHRLERELFPEYIKQYYDVKESKLVIDQLKQKLQPLTRTNINSPRNKVVLSRFVDLDTGASLLDMALGVQKTLKDAPEEEQKKGITNIKILIKYGVSAFVLNEKNENAFQSSGIKEDLGQYKSESTFNPTVLYSLRRYYGVLWSALIAQIQITPRRSGLQKKVIDSLLKYTTHMAEWYQNIVYRISEKQLWIPVETMQRSLYDVIQVMEAIDNAQDKKNDGPIKKILKEYTKEYNRYKFDSNKNKYKDPKFYAAMMEILNNINDDSLIVVENKNPDLKQQLEEKTIEANNSREIIRKLKKKKKDQKITIKTQRQLISTLQSDKERLTIEKTQLELQADELKKQKNQIADLQTEKEQHGTQIHQLRIEKEQQGKQLEEQKKQLRQVQENFAAQKEEQERQLQDKLAAQKEEQERKLAAQKEEFKEMNEGMQKTFQQQMEQQMQQMEQRMLQMQKGFSSSNQPPIQQDGPPQQVQQVVIDSNIVLATSELKESVAANKSSLFNKGTTAGKQTGDHNESHTDTSTSVSQPQNP